MTHTHSTFKMIHFQPERNEGEQERERGRKRERLRERNVEPPSIRTNTPTHHVLSDSKENKNWSEPEVWSRLSVSLTLFLSACSREYVREWTEIEMSITGPLDCPFARSINPLIGVFLHSSFCLSPFSFSHCLFLSTLLMNLQNRLTDTVTAGFGQTVRG